MNNNFLKILISVCTGTESFKRITKFTLFRAFRHLIILSILCSLAYVLVKSPGMKNDINLIAAYFQKQFGSVIVKKNGVYPTNSPELPRSMSYNSIQIKYLPKAPTDNKFEIDEKMNNSGILWMPNGVVGWLKLDDSNFFVYQSLTSLDSHSWFGIVSKDDISSYLQKCIINDFKYLRFSFFIPTNVPLFGMLTLQENNNPLHYSDTIFYWSAFGVFLRFVITIIFNCMFYSLIFALIYSISRRSNLYNLKFKAFFVTAVYAGFPGIVIGTIFSIIEVPWLQYQTVYMISFVVYLMAITKKLRELDSGRDSSLHQQ